MNQWGMSTNRYTIVGETVQNQAKLKQTSHLDYVESPLHHDCHQNRNHKHLQISQHLSGGGLKEELHCKLEVVVHCVQGLNKHRISSVSQIREGTRKIPSQTINWNDQVQ